MRDRPAEDAEPRHHLCLQVGGLPAVALHRRLVGGGVGFELRERVREHLLAAAVRAGDVVQVGDVRGVRGRFDRGEAGVGDRRRRQAGVGARVVRRVDVQLRFGEFAACRSAMPFCELDRVVDRRVDPERHPAVAGGCRSPRRSSPGRRAPAPRARPSRRRSAAGRASRAARAARAIICGPKFSLNGRQLLFDEAADRARRVHVVGRREQEAFEVGRAAAARRRRRGPAAASCARRPVAAAAAPPARRSGRSAARVLPSGITTLTSVGAPAETVFVSFEPGAEQQHDGRDDGRERDQR